MDSSGNSAGLSNAFIIVSFSLGCCCILICCVGHIVSRKKQLKQNQIHTVQNQQHTPTVHSHIFTVEVPRTQSSDIEMAPPSYSSDVENPPPPYESIERPETIKEDESDTTVSPVEHIEQTT